MKAEGWIVDYAPLAAGMDAYYAIQNGRQMGESAKAMQVVVDMVESETAPCG